MRGPASEREDPADRDLPALGLSVVDILGLPVVRAPGAEVLSTIDAALTGRPRLTIGFVNAHTATLADRDPRFSRCLAGFDLLLNDGIGVALAARLAGRRVNENLNGSDFTVRLLRVAARRGRSVFLYGARPGVGEEAGRRLAASIPGLEIAGSAHGYHPDPAPVVAEIRATGAQIVLVALGNPRQEQWLAEHLDATGAHCGVAVGAFLDFTAGQVRRAPAWANGLGIEWLFRLAQEPRRLARRYLLGVPEFAWRIARHRRRAGTRGPAR